MALIKCPECGRENVSETAQQCPNCGFGINDYFIEQKNKQIAERKAEQDRLQAKLQEEKKTEVMKQRLANVKMPQCPPKGKYIALSIVSCVVGLLFLIAAFFDEFDFFCFLVAAISFFAPFLIHSFYNDACSDYNMAKKDFSAYQKHVILMEDARKEVEERIANNRYREEIPSVRCPKCGSTSIATVNRGYSLVWGFIGSGKPMNVCQKCGHKFKPGS